MITISDKGELFLDYNKVKYRVLSINWSNIGLCVCINGKNIKWYDNWESLQEEGMFYPEKGKGNPPLVLVTESTFESYNPIGRNEVIKDIYKRGNIILTISPRATAHKRFELGRMGMQFTNKIKMTSEGQKKKEENDSKVIYEIVKEGKVHLKVPQIVKLDFTNPAKAFELHRRHDFDKWEGKPNLPDPSQYSKEFQIMWCDSQKLKLKTPKYIYDWKIVGPMYLAYLKSNKTKKDFERLIGCNSSGYPSYARATWYRRVFSTQMYRRSASKKGIILQPRLKQTDARRVTRQLFHIFKASEGILYPEKGILNPLSPHIYKQ